MTNNSSQTEILKPNYDKLDFALRSVGYSFEAAVADIVDNSIDAGASDISIRFVLKDQEPLDLVIWDNGCGMSESTLREAMRFGADVNKELERLGKFGLGLKLASLGQAKELRVVTLQDSKLSGRAWLEEGIRKGFQSYILGPDECEQAKSLLMPEAKWSNSGTLVWWSHLYRVGANHTNPQEHAQQLLNRLANHLALAFHRFLTGKCKIRKNLHVRMLLDIYDYNSREAGLVRRIEPLDPFGYNTSGMEDFPTRLNIEPPYDEHVIINAHIWPPNSNDNDYKLPGGTNTRQGFYFYRNDRLIQAGGWNGTRDAETHISLARLEIDFDPGFDIEVSLDVKKMNVSLPTPLAKAIQRTKSDTGVDFKRYIALAQEVYRKRAKRASELPVIPGEGIPVNLQEYLASEFHVKGAPRHRKIDFKWEDLGPNQMFIFDGEEEVIILNQVYRQQLLHGLKGSPTDIPVFKCLLFLFLQEAFYYERVGAKLRERLELANRVLIRAVKYERWE